MTPIFTWMTSVEPSWSKNRTLTKSNQSYECEHKKKKKWKWYYISFRWSAHKQKTQNKDRIWILFFIGFIYSNWVCVSEHIYLMTFCHRRSRIRTEKKVWRRQIKNRIPICTYTFWFDFLVIFRLPISHSYTADISNVCVIHSMISFASFRNTHSIKHIRNRRSQTETTTKNRRKSQMLSFYLASHQCFK